MAANLYFSSVLRIFIQILQKIFKENLASADKCYVLHFYLCAINKERKMKIKTMIVALGISLLPKRSAYEYHTRFFLFTIKLV